MSKEIVMDTNAPSSEFAMINADKETISLFISYYSTGCYLNRHAIDDLCLFQIMTMCVI